MTMKDTERAQVIGYEHGKSAASWVFDGNTDTATYRKVLEMLEEGDPEVWDLLPSADFSGQWADSYSMRDLAEDVDVDEDDENYMEIVSELCDAYEIGYNDGVQVEVTRIATYHLQD